MILEQYKNKQYASNTTFRWFGETIVAIVK